MSASRSEVMRRVAYLAASVSLIASQNLVAWIARQTYADGRPLDLEFWLTPLSSTLELWSLPAIWGAVIFAYCLLVTWLLALLSFRLAQRTNRGFVLAVLSVVPVVQLAAIALNAILPSKDALDEEGQATHHASKNVALGLLAGVALIVFAVLISAVTFGAYGWGLFVMTPFLVGITTGYLVNSESDLGSSRTMKLAIAAAGLGSLALVVLALEGIVCILLAAPLAVPIVMLGAALGRGLAIARHMCDESFRCPLFAADIRRQRVSRMRGFRHWKWHVDEVYVRINGEMHCLWRAVDYEGEVLESFVTKTRDKAAVLRFLKKALKRYGKAEKIVTDGLRSYPAAMRDLGNNDRQEMGRHLNNRAENSHLPFRRRERAMLRFRQMKSLQKFASIHASLHNHFNSERYLVDRITYKARRSAALAEWQSLVG